MWRHPKYYKELRKLRNKSDQAISFGTASTDDAGVRPGPGHKLQAPSSSNLKRQASSPKHKGSSFKPQAASSWTLLPGKSFKHLWSRDSTKINELLGWRTWNAIWCGENLILFPLQTFSSTVKKCPEVLYPNKSGVPDKLRFSSLIHDISGIDFLSFAYNFCSGFKGS